MSKLKFAEEKYWTCIKLFYGNKFLTNPSNLIKKSTIPTYFSIEKSLSAVLTLMTGNDGLSFHVFCTSTDLRLALLVKGFKEIPKSANTIKKMVVDYSISMRGEITKQISNIKLNKKFSLTFDEWTSVRNRRH